MYILNEKQLNASVFQKYLFTIFFQDILDWIRIKSKIDTDILLFKQSFIKTVKKELKNH